MTPEGKKVVVAQKNDNCLYESPHNPPNTGSRYTSGTDLYVRTARSGAVYYYSHSWSMWQGVEPKYALMSHDEMRRAILEYAGEAGPAAISDREKENIEGYFPGIFDEDA